MNNTKWKLIVGGVVIVVVLGWLAFSGFEESNTYYKTVEELLAMKEKAIGLRVRIAGDLVPGSVQRQGEVILFRLQQNDYSIAIRYTGKAVLPDSFQEGSQAICEGSLTSDGLFVAKKVQAKCASKYEAAPKKATE
jgi:cytochrome c-type biogenesis protein CcmE